MMKRNGVLFICFQFLILCILCAAWLKLNGCSEMSDFILMALTASGTCGVVFLTIMPYKPQDKLSAVLYYEPEDDPNIYKIKIINKTNHTICLGLRKDYAPYPDNLFLWWPKEIEKTYEKARTIWYGQDVVFSIPPKNVAFYRLQKSWFENVDMKNVKMQVLTNTGYKCDVVNML